MTARFPALLLSVCFCLVTFSARSFSDVITLKDGTTIEGNLKKSDDGYDVTAVTGKVTKVSQSQIKSIELKPLGTGDEAQKRLESLRRSSENLTDAKAALARYKDFVSKFPNSSAAQDAKQDLTLWQERIDKGMTKVGDRWVLPAQVAAIQQEAMNSVAKARDAIRQSRLKEASTLIDVALRDDPKNSAAMYLRGLLLYRQEQLGPARKMFETVLAQMPEHGPTLNNLAVVYWRQNNYVIAINSFDAALLAMPGDVTLLNNVAEALNALPSEQRDIAATKKLARHFNEQDQALAEKMKKEGRYRWGASWVTGPELDKLQAKEREVKDKIAVLEDQFAAAKAQLQQIDDEIADTQRAIRRIEADSYRMDSAGRPIRRAYPQLYYDLRRDLQDLQRNYANQEQAIEKLRADGKKIQQEIPVPRYSGTQRLIDVEGTPLLPPEAPPAPATAPAPPPATAPAQPATRPPGPPYREDPPSSPALGR